jgi:hypothetical protein
MFIGEAPFQRKFMFKMQGRKASYLAVVVTSAPVELQILPLKDASKSECISGRKN